MQLVLTDDQAMLAQTAGAFVAEHSPLSRVRKLRDDNDERGYSLPLYKQMAELGWTAIPFSEADGGLDMGVASLILVTEAMGRALAPEPLLGSVALSATALAAAGSADQKARYLAAAIAGDKVLALAYAEEGHRGDPSAIALQATRKGDGFVLSGRKHHVIDGHLADAFVVAARSDKNASGAEGITLFLVPADRKGVSTTRLQRVDSRNCALVELDSVEVGLGEVVGEQGGGYRVLCDAIDRATVALCGEMLGGMSEAFDRTVAYLKERKQFGVLIGTFQALKHRAARMYIELELARSSVMAAARALDDNDPEAAALVSLAKARCSDTYCMIANEAVQMHGGIGMTDEHDIGFYIKRARVCEITFGDAAYHRDRFATLSGF